MKLPCCRVRLSKRPTRIVAARCRAATCRYCSPQLQATNAELLCPPTCTHTQNACRLSMAASTAACCCATSCVCYRQQMLNYFAHTPVYSCAEGAQVVNGYPLLLLTANNILQKQTCPPVPAVASRAKAAPVVNGAPPLLLIADDASLATAENAPLTCKLV